MSFFIPCTSTYNDAILSRKAILSLRVTIDPDGTPVDLTDSLDNNQVTISAKSAYSQARLTLRNEYGSFSEGNYASQKILIEAKAGEAEYITIFTGYTEEKGCSLTKGAKGKNRATLIAFDLTKSKGTRRTPDTAILTGFKLCNPSSVSTSILHHLAAAMGLASSDVVAGLIDYTKEYVGIGDDTAWTELQRLQDILRAEMYFRHDGKLLFSSPFETGYSEPVAEWTFDQKNIHGNPVMKNEYNEIACNRATSSFTLLRDVGTQVLYRNVDEYDYDEGTDTISIIIGPGQYWPGDGENDIARLHYKNPVTGIEYPYASTVEIPTIGAVGSGSDIEHDGGTLEIESFNGTAGNDPDKTSQKPSYSELILKNSHETEDVEITFFRVIGNAFEEDKEIKVEAADASVSDEVDYVDDEIDGKYAPTSELAYNACSDHVEKGKVKRRKLSFNTDYIPQIQRGARVLVDIPGGASVGAIVEEYNHTAKGTYPTWRTAVVLREYVAYSATGTPRPITIDRGSAANALAARNSLDLSDRVTHTELEDGYDSGEELVTPILSAKAVGRTVALSWDFQRSMQNLDYYEIQRKKVLGGNWEGLTGPYNKETETVYIDRVDLDTDKDGQGISTLYVYRVRRVSKTEDTSEWSEELTVIASPVDTEDFRAGSVTTAVLDAGAVTMDKLIFGDPYLGNDDRISDAIIIHTEMPSAPASDGTQPAENETVFEDRKIGLVDNPHAKYWPGQSAYIGAERENLVPFPNNLTAWEEAISASCEYHTEQAIEDQVFSKVICDSSSPASIIQTVTFTGTQGSVQAIFRKGSGESSSLLNVYDDTAAATRGYVIINWILKTATFSEGANASYEWIDDDTIRFAFVANNIVAGNANRIIFYPSTTEAAGRYAYITAVQVEDNAFGTPFISSKWRFISSDNSVTRSAGGHRFTYALPDTITFDCIIRPWFNHDGGSRYILESYSDSNSRLVIYFDPGVDKFTVFWNDDGTFRVLYSQQFDDGTSFTDIKQRIRLTCQLKLATGGQTDSWFTCEPLESGSEYTSSDFGGTPDIKTSSFNDLFVAQKYTLTDQLEGELEYVRIYEQALTKLEIDSGEYEPVFEFIPEPLVNGYLPQPMGQDGCIGSWEETENLVATTDLNDNTKWDHSATYQSNGENIHDQELQKVVWKWNKGTHAVYTFVYDSLSLAAGTYSSAIWLRSNYEVRVIFRLYDGSSYYNATEVTVPANIWTLCIGEDVTSPSTVTQISWQIDQNGSSFPSDIEFRACDPTIINNPYFRPFSPGTRQRSSFWFAMQESRVGTFMCWVRPFFNYDISTQHKYVLSNQATSYGIILKYHYVQDCFSVQFNGGTTSVALYASSAFTDNVDLKKWHHLAITWDNYSHSYKIYFDGIVGDTSGTDIGALITYGFFAVGTNPKYTSPPGYEFDGLFADVFFDTRVYSELEVQKHYNKRRPWRDPSAVSNKSGGLMIDERGIYQRNGVFEQYGNGLVTKLRPGQFCFRADDWSSYVYWDPVERIIKTNLAVQIEWTEIVDKPDDSDLLNSQQQWVDVSGAGKPADNADVTAANTAAGIAGQGALATANAVNWATQVTGSGKPDDNADVTGDNTAAAISGQGALATKDQAEWGTDFHNMPSRFGEVPSGTGLFFNGLKLGFHTGGVWPIYIENDEGVGKLYAGDGGTTPGTNQYIYWDGTNFYVSGSIYAIDGFFSGIIETSTGDSIGDTRLRIEQSTISFFEKENTIPPSWVPKCVITAPSGSGPIVFSSSLQATYLYAQSNIHAGNYIDADQHYRINGTQVVTNRQATIADPSINLSFAGAQTVDLGDLIDNFTNLRTAVNTIIDRMQAHGLIA